MMAKQVTTPSEFMRQLRPEYYSDTEERTSYVLNASLLDHHLETITSRNQTQDFEIFCRKLCEKAIRPNLRPQTGPDGGGDSKADSETVPIADDLAVRTYVGDPSSSEDRWAFAFSAKKTWIAKIRSDVEGIIATGRDYKRIICVTARYAKSKARAALEDELTQQHGVAVTIHDRSWIIQQVIDENRKDLAFHYLQIGTEVADRHRLGPTDYSRSRDLENIEHELKDPASFAGMELQEVTEALLAAKLSRGLESPRFETDGRFARAIRLADAQGSYRQKLETRYEKLWTAMWWFDDVATVNTEYTAFEALALPSDDAKNLEFLSNLLQSLFNLVVVGSHTAPEVELNERAERLTQRLDAVMAIPERPNNALEAETMRLMWRLNRAMLARDSEAMSAVWPQFSDLIRRAEGMGEFNATRLVKLIDVVGTAANDDPGYDKLVEDVAEFMSERTGETEGGRVLLKRARQLDFDRRFDLIRLLGKAARKLTKKECADELIEALHILSVAYRSAGLLWAARASCIFASAAVVIESEEESEVRPSFIPMMTTYAQFACEICHLPDWLEAMQAVIGLRLGLPLTNESKATVTERIGELDLIFACRILNYTSDELAKVSKLPDVLDRLGMHQSRAALLYALGYGDMLRIEGWVPEGVDEEGVAETFNQLASQPAANRIGRPLIVNGEGVQTLQSRVMGMDVVVSFNGTTETTLAAEAVLAAIEVCFATAIELRAHAHVESLSINIVAGSAELKPVFDLDTSEMRATIIWPTGLAPASANIRGEVQTFLLEMAITVLMATCAITDHEAMIEQLMTDEAVADRISMIAFSSNSYHRVFGHGIARLQDKFVGVTTDFPPLPTRPKIVRAAQKEKDQPNPIADGEEWVNPVNHRDFGVRSLIDVHLWNKAGWKGAGYFGPSPTTPPAIALLFTDEEAAIKIFERLRERVGRVDKNEEIYLAIVRGVSETHPYQYRMMVTSRPTSADGHEAQTMTVLSRLHLMEPESDENLNRFLASFETSKSYLLMPAVWTGNDVKPLWNLAILKRELSVKDASGVTAYDIELVALGKDQRTARAQRPKAAANV